MPSLQFLQDIGLLFRTVNFNFREQVDRALRDGGVELGFGQISALGILRERPGINGAELARHGMVSPQAMNSVLRDLMGERYVERRDASQGGAGFAPRQDASGAQRERCFAEALRRDEASAEA